MPFSNRVSEGYTEPLVQRAGQAIISALHQAADITKRNEERAKARATALEQELRIAERRIASLQAELHELSYRAEQAEEWLGRVSQEVKTSLLDPLDNQSAAA
jgi:predicted  nucleic acid-binding Zn-ribbon protein